MPLPDFHATVCEMGKRSNKKDSPSPGPAPAPVSCVPPPSRWEFSKGVLVGVISSLVMQGLTDFTSVFKPKLGVRFDKSGKVEILKLIQTSDGFELAHIKYTVPITNSRIAPGFISDVKITPVNLNYMPEITLISIDREDIAAFQTRDITVEFSAKIPLNQLNSYSDVALRFYDNYSRDIGRIELQRTPGNDVKVPSEVNLPK